MQPLSLTTSRLRMTWLDLDDAAFIFRLVNDPDWIRYIGDKAVSLDDGGVLSDVAPTLLELMEIEQPAEMTGRSLIRADAARAAG